MLATELARARAVRALTPAARLVLSAVIRGAYRALHALPQRRCRVCGCTDERGCVEPDLVGGWSTCWWVESDLCSMCRTALAGTVGV